MMSGTRLRFASLIRVSTEKQEREGESLRTQTADNERSVTHLGGTITGRYGGQEHATPGWEKQEVSRLLRDSEQGKFDAVIVAYADRWSRDNAESKRGLEIFRQSGIRFFVGTSEYDLYRPEHCLMLGMSAEFGEFQARQQSKKSIDNRIARARLGRPACGKLPYGRTHDRDTGWAVVPDKQAQVAEIAARYLRGEPMPVLAAEYGHNHSNLHKILTERCGPVWVQTFKSKPLNINETVETAIPALLDDATIAAIRDQARARKTFNHGHPKYRYLLGGMIFCGYCGYVLNGQTNHGNRRYYRHGLRDGSAACMCRPRPWVVAEDIEEVVIHHLFETFGNPTAVAQAVVAATPDADKYADLRARHEDVAKQIARIAAGRDKVLNLLIDEKLSDAQAKVKLTELKTREAKYTEELARLDAELVGHPGPDEIRDAAERISARFTAVVSAANHDLEAMTYEERRTLAESVFCGTGPDGKRFGVYITKGKGLEGRKRKWAYEIRGHLIHTANSIPMTKARMDALFTFGAPVGGETRVTKKALY